MKMKFCATFAVLVAVLTTRSEAAPADELHNLDGLLTVAVEGLKEFRKVWTLSGQTVFEQSLARRKEKLLEYVDSSRDEVQAKLNEAEAAGKDVTQCSETYKSQISAAVDQVLAAAEKCVEENPPKLDKILSDVDTLLARGEELAAQIKKVEEDCSYGNSIAEQICIVRHLPKVGLRVRLYRHVAGLVGDDGLIVINDSLVAIRKCAGPALEDLKAQLESAKDNAVTCAEGDAVPETTEASEELTQAPEVQPAQVSEEQ